MKKDSNIITIIYNKQSYTIDMTEYPDLNYSYIIDLIIKNFNISLPEEKELFLCYIEVEKPEEKILISNNENLNYIIKNHQRYSPDKTIKIEAYIFEKQKENEITNSLISPTLFRLIENKKSGNNNNDVNNLDNIYDNSEINYFKERCRGCDLNIKKNMFTCLICDNYFLCDKCFFKHSNQHPMFVISKGLNKPFIESQKDIKLFIEKKKEANFNLINYYSLNLIVPQHKKFFYLPFGSKRTIELIIQNKGFTIDFPVFVLIKNSKGLEIKSNYFSRLLKNNMTQIFIEIKNNDKVEKIYSLDIILYANGKEIKYNQIYLTVNVTSEEKANNGNIQMFKKYNNISKWSKDLQIFLFDELFEGNLKTDLNVLNEFIYNNEVQKIEDLYPFLSNIK